MGWPALIPALATLTLAIISGIENAVEANEETTDASKLTGAVANNSDIDFKVTLYEANHGKWTTTFAKGYILSSINSVLNTCAQNAIAVLGMDSVGLTIQNQNESDNTNIILHEGLNHWVMLSNGAIVLANNHAYGLTVLNQNISNNAKIILHQGYNLWDICPNGGIVLKSDPSFGLTVVNNEYKDNTAIVLSNNYSTWTNTPSGSALTNVNGPIYAIGGATEIERENWVSNELSDDVRGKECAKTATLEVKAEGSGMGTAVSLLLQDIQDENRYIVLMMRRLSGGKYGAGVSMSYGSWLSDGGLLPSQDADGSKIEDHIRNVHTDKCVFSEGERNGFTRTATLTRGDEKMASFNGIKVVCKGAGKETNWIISKDN